MSSSNQDNVLLTAVSAASSLLLYSLYSSKHEARRTQLLETIVPTSEENDDDDDLSSSSDKENNVQEENRETNDSSNYSNIKKVDKQRSNSVETLSSITLPTSSKFDLRQRRSSVTFAPPPQQINLNDNANTPPPSPSNKHQKAPLSPSYENPHDCDSNDYSSDSDLSYDEVFLSKSFGFHKQDSDLSNDQDDDIGNDNDMENNDEDLENEEPYDEFNTLSEECVYLDYNGTTPIDSQVLNTMIPYMTRHFGNPSSSHAYGLVPKSAMDKARKSVLSLLFSKRRMRDGNSLIFTGCGTEADNLAIQMAIQCHRNGTTEKNKKMHVVTSNVEHPAVAQALKALEESGDLEVTYVPVNQQGSVSAQDMINAIKPNQTILVTLMLANNESGALQPVKEVADECRKQNILFHTDAAQAVGKVSIALDEMGIGEGVDMVTIVGHKFGAPKGVAALYVRPGCLEECGRSLGTKGQVTISTAGVLLIGGGQEGGRRGGTENVPYIVGMGEAASILTTKTKCKYLRWQKNALQMEKMRTRLLKHLIDGLGEDVVEPNGPTDPSQRLPNTLSVGLKGVHSGELLKRIQMHVACSAGSACHSGGCESISPVLLAMKIPLANARGTLRLSVGPGTTPEDVDKASTLIVIEAKRQLAPKSGEGCGRLTL